MKALKIAGWVLGVAAYSALLIYGMRYATLKNLEVVPPRVQPAIHCNSSVNAGPIVVRKFNGKVIGQWNAKDVIYCISSDKPYSTLTIITRGKDIVIDHGVTFMFGR